MSSVSDYDYELPRDLVAQHPLANRADARLMVIDRLSSSITHSHVRDLPSLLRAGDVMVINDTQVVPARLVGFRTATGGHWEGLYLAHDAQGSWKLLGKSRGKIQPGETVTIVNPAGEPDIQVRLVVQQHDGVWIARPESFEKTFSLLNRIGRVPLPPYIRDGEMEPRDRERYQTVFARTPGAVAAPTAGLHFIVELLEKLEQGGVLICRVTLHVGLDTFRPIGAAGLAEHQMHSEWGQISAETVQTIHQAQRGGGRTIAVGTTSVRVLESAARGGELQAWSGTTDLFIRPPYRFRAVDALLTNFHLPRTTLLVLVRTFGGDALLRRAYEEAIREQYRFYSYGDAMLIW